MQSVHKLCIFNLNKFQSKTDPYDNIILEKLHNPQTMKTNNETIFQFFFL